METLTISKKQAKKTLSGKKAKRETIKNVLAKPYDNYWPLLGPEDNDQLVQTLERLLPRLRNKKISVPYEDIKRVPKNERKKFREDYIKQDPLKVDDAIKANLVFGVNDVAHLIENLDAGSVLVASDVRPRLLVQHVLDLAVLYDVPVLVVKDLRTVLKNRCGISGAVVAFKVLIKADSELGLIQQIILNISENYPVPETHINYHRRLKNISAVTISDSEEDRSDNIVSVDDSEDDVGSDRKNYHLRRGPSRKRVFEPQQSQTEERKTEVIYFGNVDSASSVKNDNSRLNYRPLMVKRLRGNKNRNKRKIEKIKESRK